jgi:hypothetical protein
LSPQNNLARRTGCLTTKPQTGPAGYLPPNLLGGEEEPIKMSYIPHILTFLLVLSPLFIPIGVTVVHAIRTWR